VDAAPFALPVAAPLDLALPRFDTSDA